MRLKPYPDYKESQQQWLGKVPSHWEIRPSKSVFSLRNEPENAGDVHLTPSQSLGVLPQLEYMKVTGNRVVLALAGTTMKHVEVNDFVIHLRSFQGGIEWSGLQGKVSPAYTVLRPNANVVPAFFRYCLKSRGYIETIASLTDQLRDGQSMRYYDFGKTPLPLPPVSEQQLVADFLDRETAEIDAFIADQEELIALLGERRTATITHAVTKGLNPDTPMKDSGVTWLGEVPVHWPLSKLGHHFEVVLGKMLDGAKEAPIGARMLPYVRAGNIQDAGLDLSEVNEMAYTSYEAERLNLIAKDLLVVEGGSVGTVHYLDSAMDGWSFQKTVNRVRSLGSADTKYLGHLIRALRDSGVFEVICNGSTIMHLTAEKLRALMIPVPAVDEQRAITLFIDHETVEIDAAITDAREAIALSKERRAAVISAVVTGKIDVRGVLAPAAIKVEVESVGVA